MTPDEWLGLLQANGCRLTKARRAVIDVVSESRRALTPQEVFELARQKEPRLGLVTIYRTLEKLEKLGLARRVHQEHGCNAYLAHSSGHRHLIICQVCGRAEYFEGDDLESLFNRVADDHGFLIREHWLQLFGVCQTCRG